MMYKALLICALFLSTSIWCQRHYGRPRVVKDNIACLYGLKNDSNEWILPPQFNTLKDQYTYYLAGDANSQLGIINLQGKIIVPVQYDKIIPLNNLRAAPDVFIVTKNSKSGILDSTGKEIVPLIYDELNFVQLSAFPHRYFVLRKADQYALIDNKLNYFIPFSNLNIITNTRENIPGKILVRDQNGRYGMADSTGIAIQPYYKSITGFDGKSFVASDMKSGLLGLVNESGDTLLSFDHTGIETSGIPENRIIATRENTFGIYNSSMDIIIPEGTFFLEHIHEKYPLRNSTDTIAARRDNEWGFLSGTGLWVTEQIYDTIIPPDFTPNNLQAQFIFRSNGKYGAMLKNGNIAIPQVYDMLIQVSDTRYSSSQSGCIVYTHVSGSYFYIGKINGFYGATKSNGGHFIPFIYDTIIPVSGNYNTAFDQKNSTYKYSRGDQYFLGDGKALYLQREREYDSWSYVPTIAIELSFFFNLNAKIHVYKGGNRYLPFTEVKYRNGNLLVPDNSSNIEVARKNSDLLEAVEKPGDKPKYYDRKTGKLVKDPLEDFRLVERVGAHHMFISSDNKLGLVSEKGVIVLQPEYVGLSKVTTFNGRELLWTKSEADTNCNSYTQGDNCACGWKLCEMNGKPVTKIIFDYPQDLNFEVVPMAVNGKIGLFNTTLMRWATAPVYTDIVSFDSFNSRNDRYQSNTTDLFYVIRNTSQFGVMNSNGKWITDSTCNYMIPYPRRTETLYSKKTASFSAKRWLLVSDESQIMIDAHGQTTTDSMLIDTLIFQSFTMLDFYGHNIPTYTRDGPQVSYPFYYQFSNKQQLPLQKDSMYLKALSEANMVLLQFFGPRIFQKPGSYSIGGHAFVIDEYVRDTYGHHQTCYPKNSENLVASIIFRSDQVLSLKTGFNPDSSANARDKFGTFYLNYRKTADGKFTAITLDSLFCPSVQYEFLLNKLIREDIRKRDDLNIDCGSEDKFYERTKDRYYFLENGLAFDLVIGQRPVVIPWIQLQPYSISGGLIDQIYAKPNEEHCRPAYDTTVINYSTEGIYTCKDLYSSDFLTRNHVLTQQLIFSDSAKQIVTGIRFCDGCSTSIEVYIQPVASRNKISAHKSFVKQNERAPKFLRKSRVKYLYSIAHYPCT